LLKVACRWPGRDLNPQHESYESDTLPLDHLHLPLSSLECEGSEYIAASCGRTAVSSGVLRCPAASCGRPAVSCGFQTDRFKDSPRGAVLKCVWCVCVQCVCQVSKTRPISSSTRRILAYLFLLLRCYAAGPRLV